MKGVGLIVELAIVGPRDTPITTATNHGLSDYPASFHRSNLYYIKGLQQGNIIGTISFHEDSITSIHLNRASLVKEIHRDLLSIMRWYKDLIASKVFSINSWVAHELQLLNHPL